MQKAPPVGGAFFVSAFRFYTNTRTRMSGVTHVQSRLPEVDPSADANVDALLDSKLRHFHNRIARVKHLRVDPANFVSEHECPTFQRRRPPILQFYASGCLLHSSHFPTLCLKRFHRTKCRFVRPPRHVIAGAECTFQDVAVRGLARDSAQVEAIDAERVGRPKARTDVLSAADVVQNQTQRQPRCSRKFVSKQAFSFSALDHVT